VALVARAEVAEVCERFATSFVQRVSVICSLDYFIKDHVSSV
jgi:hypothetical protein